MKRSGLRLLLGYAYFLAQPSRELSASKAKRYLTPTYLRSFRIRKETNITSTDLLMASSYALDLRRLMLSKPRSVISLRDLPIDQLAERLSDLLSQ